MGGDVARITRRAVVAATGGTLGAGALTSAGQARTAAVERWGVHEITLSGPAGGNPFVDVMLEATFTSGATTVTTTGFYDDDGIYRIRISPPETGRWTWSSRSNVSALDGQTGDFEVGPAVESNHGPVSVAAGYHFAYADGTPFRQIGTTSYGWSHQSEAMRRLTLETLRRAPFNKIRMAVLPNAAMKTNEGPSPFEGEAERFDPVFFRRLDACVQGLMALGVEADLILFHPYDEASGHHAMSAAGDERYLRYVVARFAAYRNVWWSMANEYDLVKAKSAADWDRLFQVVRDADPYGRPRSIHNWRELYDNGKPWVTHSSIQNGSAVLDDVRAETYRSVWKKAVIFDEVCYEGSLEQRWGDLTGPEMVRAFWHGLIAGTYVGHSECLRDNPDEGFWLGQGGELKGESPPRLAFLKSVMEAGPTPGIDPIDKWWEQHLGGVAGRYYLRYFGNAAPTDWALDLPRDELTGGERFRAEVIDTWNMTIEPIPGAFTMAAKGRYFFHDPARPTVALPGRPWMAVRVTRVG